MSRLAIGGFIIFMLSLTAQARAPECPDPVSVMEIIFSVEASDDPDKEKISRLTGLMKLYDGCELPKDSVYARILHRLGDLYRMSGDFEKGIRFTQNAIKINQSGTAVTSPSYLTNSYYNLGLYHALLSNFDKSNDYFDSCIVNGSKYYNKINIVLMAYEQKCFNYYRIGEFGKCIDAADNGILVARKNKDISYQGILLQQKAQSQLLLGKDNDAALNSEKAIEILRSADIPKEYLASAYSIYARVLLSRGEPEKAIQYYKRSITINQEIENWTQCSADYLDVGYLYDYTLRDSSRALQCYRKGLEILSKSSDPYQLAALYNNIGVVYWRNKNYAKALRFYQRGLMALPGQFSDTSISANPSHQMIKLMTNDYFVATIFQNKGESLLGLYKTSGGKHFLSDALNAFHAADKVIDQMRWRQVQESSKLYWRKKTREMYLNAVETCYLLGDIENAFFFFEKSRAVLLSDKLNELGANKVLRKEDAQEETRLRSELYTLQSSLQSTTPESKDRDELQQRWYASQQRLEQHIKTLERKYPEYFQYKFDTTSLTLHDIQQTLARENQTLIEYFTADTVLYSLAIGPKSSALKKTSFPAFKESIQTYLDLCSTPSALNARYKDFENVSNLLYQHFFHDLPVETKRVVVSFDDYFIPFESFLTDRNEPTSFLLKQHIFQYIYSAAYFSRKSNDPPVENSLLAVAPVSYQTSLNLSPLKGAEHSLQTIESYFNSSVSLIKDAATKQSFIKSFPEYAVVHVYSHAMADYEGEEPMLYFHDEPVTLKDLQMLPEVKTQLLVLSGCRTGVGTVVKGEGVLSLARGFASAGIPSTITTLWSVDDKVTYDIMEKFYKHLRDGLSSDEALQKAKIDFLDQQDGEYELPYYWASTVSLGSSTTIETSGHDGKKFLLFGAAAILSIAAFFIGRRKSQ